MYKRQNIAAKWVRLYQLIAVIMFYASNYIFRPSRLFKTIYNLVKGKHESRAEDTFADLIKKKKNLYVTDKALIIEYVRS